MASPTRLRAASAPRLADPLLGFRFIVIWDGAVVAGVSKVGALQRKTEKVGYGTHLRFAFHERPAATVDTAVTVRDGRVASQRGGSAPSKSCRCWSQGAEALVDQFAEALRRRRFEMLGRTSARGVRRSVTDANQQRRLVRFVQTLVAGAAGRGRRAAARPRPRRDPTARRRSTQRDDGHRRGLSGHRLRPPAPELVAPEVTCSRVSDGHSRAGSDQHRARAWLGWGPGLWRCHRTGTGRRVGIVALYDAGRLRAPKGGLGACRWCRRWANRGRSGRDHRRARSAP